MHGAIENLIKEALGKLDLPEADFSVERPADLSHGDWSSNISMVLSKEVGKNPRQLAEEIKDELADELASASSSGIEKIEVAGPGFINFYLKDDYFRENLKKILERPDTYGKNKNLYEKRVVVEYTQPNILKPFHIGHLMSNAIGEAISRIVEFSGAETKRVNYQGDVGLHVAKAIWGMKQLGNEMPAESDSLADKSEFLGNAYVYGAGQYEENQEIKKEVDELNVRIYKGGDEEIENLYQIGRKWSLEHFEDIYETLGSKFDRLYFESETASIGERNVHQNIGKVFEKSEGAVIYKGEEKGLHTRVFINSNGIPTYEAKELALPKLKFEEFEYDISIVVTAEEQREYFKVVLSALSEIEPELAKKTKHMTHGMMQLSSGKMSSRKGNVITGESLLKDTIARVREIMEDRGELSENEKDDASKQVAVAAIKFSILRQSSGKNIVYDEKKATSFEGDSGPYLQYTYARIMSLLEKAKSLGLGPSLDNFEGEAGELERIVERFPEAVERSQKELEPHYVAQYLLDLAGSFNTFYGREKIVDEGNPEGSAYKLAISQAIAHILKNGLWVLGIEAPEKM